MTTLSLKGNHLGSLSPKLAQLSALRVLDVSENGLTALPEGVAALEALEVLDVSENQLEAFPEGLAPCGTQISGAPRRRRDVVPVTASARWLTG